MDSRLDGISRAAYESSLHEDKGSEEVPIMREIGGARSTSIETRIKRIFWHIVLKQEVHMRQSKSTDTEIVAILREG